MRIVSLVLRVMPEQIPTARAGLEQIPACRCTPRISTPDA